MRLMVEARAQHVGINSRKVEAMAVAQACTLPPTESEQTTLANSLWSANEAGEIHDDPQPQKSTAHTLDKFTRSDAPKGPHGANTLIGIAEHRRVVLHS